MTVLRIIVMPSLEPVGKMIDILGLIQMKKIVQSNHIQTLQKTVKNILN